MYGTIDIKCQLYHLNIDCWKLISQFFSFNMEGLVFKGIICSQYNSWVKHHKPAKSKLLFDSTQSDVTVIEQHGN